MMQNQRLRKIRPLKKCSVAKKMVKINIRVPPLQLVSGRERPTERIGLEQGVLSESKRIKVRI